MIKTLGLILEGSKRIYLFSKKELAIGETEEAVRRKKVKEAVNAFSDIDAFIRSYEEGVVAFAIDELKEEYTLSDDRVRYYNETLRNIYETLISGRNIWPEQIEELELFRSILTTLESQLYLDINKKREKIDEEKELIAKLSFLLESFEKGKDEVTLEDIKSVSDIEDTSSVYKDFKKEFYIHAIRTNENKTEKIHIDVKQLMRLLKEYGYNKAIEEFTIEEQEEILRNSNLDKVKEILSLINNLGILNKFPIKHLTSILLYGSKEKISDQYSNMSSDGTLDNDVYYCSSVWIRNRIYTEELDFINKMREKKEISPLYELTKEPPYEVIKENMEFLSKKGYAISKEDNETCRLWNRTLIHKYNYLETLGVKPNSMLLQLNKEEFDTLIDGYIEAEEIRIIIDGFPTELYDLHKKILLGLWISKKQNSDEYSQNVFGMENGKRVLKTEFLEFIKNKSTLEMFDIAIKSGLVIPNMPKKDFYDTLIEDVGLINIDDDDYEYPEIKELDYRHKMEDTTYAFGSNKTGVQIVSRPKVLRIFGALMQSGLVDDEKEALLYALTYNSFLDKEGYDLIKQSIGYTDKKSFIY